MASGTDPISPSSDSSRIPPLLPPSSMPISDNSNIHPLPKTDSVTQESQENNSPHRQPAVKQGTAAQCDPSAPCSRYTWKQGASSTWNLHLYERNRSTLHLPCPNLPGWGREETSAPTSFHSIFSFVSHVTSPPPMSPSPPSRYQTNLQIRRVPACLPPNNLTPRTQRPSGTSPSDSGRFAKIRPNPDARRPPFSSRASRACVSHLFLRCR